MKRGWPMVCAAGFVLLALLLAGFTPPSARGEEKAPPGLGKKALAILKGATRVEVFRIKPRQDPAAKKQIGGYPVTATGKELGKEFAADLTRALLDEKTWNGSAARCFNPGVAFRVHSSDKETGGSVDVIICFACTNFRLQVNDAGGKAEFKSGGAFGPKLSPLLALAKKAFPDDKEIQGLSEKGQ
jgi:hypothetical protein